MAQQTLQPHAEPGIPGIRYHFWDPDTSCYCLMKKIHSTAHDEEYEYLIWAGWRDICGLYFPISAVTPNGPRWHFWVETRLSPRAPFYKWPDHIAAKCLPIRPNDIPVLGNTYLCIKCKWANFDTPSGWREVLAEFVSSLSAKYTDQVLFLIVAVGWKCMYFVWDPLNEIHQPQLFIHPSNGLQPWLVDTRIKAIHSTEWVNTTTGEISCEHAMELECWETVSIAGQNVLRNRNALGMIEQFLVGVQSAGAALELKATALWEQNATAALEQNPTAF
ncbi:hypothetical protein yc1106_01798 [Curvularia clavata]|uniref:Uncharacterized protein n=1 Tax=Curvularia clavata TaxID=95742 RepID=A0A9Q8Z466_CURCL|nr:hypothetical protein yc1106_01798 [Curvularia clavata]